MDLHARADRLAHLIEEKLDTRGKGLEAKVRRAGRNLPKFIRAEAGLLIEALKVEAHPKLARQIDEARLEQAYANVERYLKGLDPWARRRGVVLNWLAGNALNLLIVAALTVAVLRWRGFL
ncbi:MAG TPA: hypothetical protein ENK28_14230 [Aliiroseovarius sp.]|nr:hypothetical protein [Aliiroseovarius sp.]